MSMSTNNDSGYGPGSSREATPVNNVGRAGSDHSDSSETPTVVEDNGNGNGNGPFAGAPANDLGPLANAAAAAAAAAAADALTEALINANRHGVPFPVHATVGITQYWAMKYYTFDTGLWDQGVSHRTTEGRFLGGFVSAASAEAAVRAAAAEAQVLYGIDAEQWEVDLGDLATGGNKGLSMKVDTYGDMVDDHVEIMVWFVKGVVRA
jgi:hypothetical protein